MTVSLNEGTPVWPKKTITILILVWNPKRVPTLFGIRRPKSLNPIYYISLYCNYITLCNAYPEKARLLLGTPHTVAPAFLGEGHP